MEEKKKLLPNMKVAFRPSSPALKIALMALIVFSILALIALRWVHNGILEETQNLKDEAAAIEQANQDLEEKTKDPDSLENVKDIAREELGLEDPNTVIIDPQ